MKIGFLEFKEIDKTGLIKCIEVNNYDFFKFLISRKNIDLFKNDMNQLFYAIQQQTPEIAPLLLALKDIIINIESTNKFEKKISKYVKHFNCERLLYREGERTRTPLSYDKPKLDILGPAINFAQQMEQRWNSIFKLLFIIIFNDCLFIIINLLMSQISIQILFCLAFLFLNSIS